MKTKRAEKIAIYAGSFDPITNGHLRIIGKAMKLFDRLIVGVGKSGSKNAFFSPEERLEMAQEACKKWANVEVKMFAGFTVDLAKAQNAIALVRGLRSGDDFTNEMAMAQMNKHLAEHIETIFIPTDPNYFHVSSSLVKEIALFGGDLSDFVPPIVCKKFAAKKSREG